MSKLSGHKIFVADYQLACVNQVIKKVIRFTARKNVNKWRKAIKDVREVNKILTGNKVNTFLGTFKIAVYEVKKTTHQSTQMMLTTGQRMKVDTEATSAHPLSSCQK